MVAITFDTLAFAEKLTTSGVSEAQARAHVRAMAEAFEARDLVTRNELR